MKTAIAILSSALFAFPALAVEFVTLIPAAATKSVNATDVVEVVGTNMNNDGTAAALRMTFAADPSKPIDMVLRGKETGFSFDDMKGNKFTGLTSLALLTAAGQRVALTLKITPAEEISVAAEGTVLVVPDSTEGDLKVLVESSDDMVSWSTFLEQAITAGTSPKFYRTRIIKNVSP